MGIGRVNYEIGVCAGEWEGVKWVFMRYMGKGNRFLWLVVCWCRNVRLALLVDEVYCRRQQHIWSLIRVAV